MSILGFRLGEAAREALLLRAGADSRLSATYFHQTCAVDGIQLATTCTLGNANITVVRQGEHRLLLRAEGSDIAVEASLTAAALELGREYAALRETLAATAAGSSRADPTAQRMEALLTRLEEAPAPLLVTVAGGGTDGP